MSAVQRAVLGTPVGSIEVTAGPTGVSRVRWLSASSSAYASPTPPPTHTPPPGAGVLADAVAQLGDYFAGSRHEFSVPVELGSLTPSTRQVLLALLEVPYGSAITYGELAQLSATGLPARAIGSVMGANPVPILIACHRVLAGDGLGGYSGGLPGQGLETKRWLLEHEGILPPRLW